ncbi:hypothetical protein T492DRAFT_1109551 [Pavlovales sp. CCMP2436]|nr:hypothetical protein T492DRAFT_1109551 [Pavlovales sp. CCMP2436]
MAAGAEPPKPRQPAVRWYTLARPPLTLTLHLKRFAAAKGRTAKVNGHVAFPLALELSPFCAADSEPPTSLGQLSARQAAGGGAGGGRSRHTYALTAVVVHQGSMRGGHYIAFVKAVAGWFLVSDTSVASATEAEVLGAQAFLLFYDKLGNGEAGAPEPMDVEVRD